MEEKKTVKAKLTPLQMGIILLVLLSIFSVFAYKNLIPTKHNPQAANQLPTENNNLPRLVDLGSGTCIPCKQMAPILEELKNEYKDRIIVEVIDVHDYPDEAAKYGIRVIPTQILYDAEGKEVYRHEGFIPKEELIKEFELVGVQ